MFSVPNFKAESFHECLKLYDLELTSMSIESSEKTKKAERPYSDNFLLIDTKCLDFELLLNVLFS